mmetsp:Transcript_36519/g.96185  ORF Transcript_36519/g.96185 Transcript_36519/m.96185 type:complete len:225 (+) Transcript_36519:680-1354(+)
MVKTFLEDDLGRPRIVIEQHLLGTLFVDLVLDARVPMVEMVLIRPLIPQLAYLFMLDPSGVHRGIDSRRPSFATVLSSTQMPPEGLDALVIDLEDDAFKVPVSTLVGASLGYSCFLSVSQQETNPNFPTVLSLDFSQAIATARPLQPAVLSVPVEPKENKKLTRGQGVSSPLRVGFRIDGGGVPHWCIENVVHLLPRIFVGRLQRGKRGHGTAGKKAAAWPSAT